MSLEGLLIGLLYILLYALVASLIVWAIIYAANYFGFPLPHPIPKILWAIVGVIVLIMLVSLLFGWRPPVPFRAGAEPPAVAGRAVAALPAAPARYLPQLLDGFTYVTDGVHIGRWKS